LRGNRDYALADTEAHRTGQCSVNDKPVNQNYRIRTHDLISLSIPKSRMKGFIPENIPVEIFYKDEHLVVVNKPLVWL